MSKLNDKTCGGADGEISVAPPTLGAGRKRGPKPKFSEMLFEQVRRRVAGGEGLVSSIKAEGLGVSRFYEHVARNPELAAELEKARQASFLHRIRLRLEKHGGQRAFKGERKRASSMARQQEKVRQLSDGALIYLLQKLAPEKYGKAVHRGEKTESGKLKAEIERKRLFNHSIIGRPYGTSAELGRRLRRGM